MARGYDHHFRVFHFAKIAGSLDFPVKLNGGGRLDHVQCLSVRQVFLYIYEDDIADPPAQYIKRRHTPDLPCTDDRNHYLYSIMKKTTENG